MIDFKLVDKKEVDAELSFGGRVIEACHSDRFARHLDSDIYLFSTIEEPEFDFFDFIGELPISELPDRTEYQIINIFPNKIENPLQELKYPFNCLTFLKLDNKFYTQFFSFTEGDTWAKKWAIEYYFAEFQKIISEFPTARIREYSEEYLSEGRLKLEILDNQSKTINEAFESALPVLNKIIDSVENNLTDAGKLLKIIETWKKNKDNKDEEFWQRLFTDYPEIVSQSFSIPIVLFKDKAYLGGKSIENLDGKIIDYAYKNNLTNNIALIEIKTPMTPLLGKPYRNTISISHDLTGSINQLLDYKDSVLKDFYSLRYKSQKEFHIINPKCLLIIGSFDKMTKKERDTFDMFRNDLKTIDILTFDELLDKLYILIKLLKEDD